MGQHNSIGGRHLSYTLTTQVLFLALDISGIKITGVHYIAWAYQEKLIMSAKPGVCSEYSHVSPSLSPQKVLKVCIFWIAVLIALLGKVLLISFFD